MSRNVRVDKSGLSLIFEQKEVFPSVDMCIIIHLGEERYNIPSMWNRVYHDINSWFVTLLEGKKKPTNTYFMLITFYNDYYGHFTKE